MKRILFTLIGIICILCIVFTGCSKKEEPAPESTSPSTEHSTEETTSEIITTNTVTTTQPTTAETTTKAETQATTTTQSVTQTPTTQKPAVTNATVDLNKKGELFKAECSDKIWANVVGTTYIVFKNIDEANEWGESGKVYEIYVAQFGNNYSMWSDGFWDISGNTLTMTPKNQSENGNIGTAVGQPITIQGSIGVFSIPLTFEQGGKTTCKLDIYK